MSGTRDVASEAATPPHGSVDLPRAHHSWSIDARTLLEHACSWHGGEALYRSVRSISLTPRHLDGLLPSLKGFRTTFSLPRRFDVFPHDRCTVFVDYPEPGYDGVFDDGHVWIRHRETGDLAADSPDHRTTLAGFARHRRWTAIDALYFFGYALWHYHTLPFTLGEAHLVGVRSTGGTRPLSILDVEFPEDLPTHSRRQSFYFDWAGRLQRHDYCAEVVSPLAYAAHAWKDYRRVDGLAVAMERRVVPQVAGWPLPLTILHASFAEVSVHLQR